MKTNRILIETILVTAVTLLGMWFLPAAKTLFALLPVVYKRYKARKGRRPGAS